MPANPDTIPALVGRTPPITTSGQTPPIHDLAPELHRPIGNTKHGGNNQVRTLWQWLTLDNRRPDYRARQAALAVIERLCSAIAAMPDASRVAELVEILVWARNELYLNMAEPTTHIIARIDAALGRKP